MGDLIGGTLARFILYSSEILLRNKSHFAIMDYARDSWI